MSKRLERVGLWVGIISGILGSITSATALANMYPITWIDWLADFFASYREIVGPVFDFIQWPLPFAIPWLLRNYLVVGIAVASGYVAGYYRIGIFQELYYISDFSKYKILKPSIKRMVFAYIFLVCIWPIHLFLQVIVNVRVIRAIRKHKERFGRADLNDDWYRSVRMLQIIGSSVVLSFILSTILILSNSAVLAVSPIAHTPDREPRPLWHIEAVEI